VDFHTNTGRVDDLVLHELVKERSDVAVEPLAA